MKQLLCLMSVLVALTPACAREQPMRIMCEIGVPRTVQGAQAATLTFTLTNAGREAIQVLNWQTPFEGVRAPMFDVTRDGLEVEYHGKMLKRGNPRHEDYIVLQPGEKRSATIDLAEGWDVTTPGSYSIVYATELFDVAPGSSPVPRALDAFTPVTLNCSAVRFTRER